MENQAMSNLSGASREEIYVIRSGVMLGPYGREEAAKLLADGTIDTNCLVRIGLEGRVFPARLLTQPPIW